MSLAITNSRFVNHVKSHEPLIAFRSGQTQPFGMRNRRQKLLDPIEIGERLRATREALGLDQRSLCRAIDIGESAYNQYEKGARPLTIGPAIKMCRRFGLTLDWLYRGDPSGLPVRLVNRLPAQTIAEDWPREAAEADVPPFDNIGQNRRRTGTNG